MKTAIEIAHGALSPYLHVQLWNQGFDLSKADLSKLEHYQKDADAITRLKVRGYLTENTTKRARHWLGKEIAALELKQREEK